MADLKISERSAAGTITGSETIGLIQSGGDVRATVGDIVEYVNSARSVKVSLSSAEILLLNGTPKTLVPAQGANTFINVISVAFRLNYNSVAYATNTTIRLEIGSFSPVVPVNNILLQTSNYWLVTLPTADLEISGSPDWVNTPLTVRVITGNPTAGNSSLDIYVTYNIVNL